MTSLECQANDPRRWVQAAFFEQVSPKTIYEIPESQGGCQPDREADDV